MALSIVNGNIGGGSTKQPITIIINGSNGQSTVIDLSKLIYADNDGDASTKGVPLKGYYLASFENTMGVKHGTLLRREI